MAALKLTPKDIERFWSKVDRSAGPDACWPWRASCFNKGYGQFSVRQLNLRAHRIAFMLSNGIAARDLLVCHSCDNPPCCNPAHLWTGTQQHNVQDMRAKGRQNDPYGDRAGARKYPERYRGEARTRTMLTDRLVSYVRHQVAVGPRGTGARLARELSISHTHLSAIIHRRRWKHVQ